jgi:hypothetical protein
VPAAGPAGDALAIEKLSCRTVGVVAETENETGFWNPGVALEVGTSVAEASEPLRPAAR